MQYWKYWKDEILRHYWNDSEIAKKCKLPQTMSNVKYEYLFIVDFYKGNDMEFLCNITSVFASYIYDFAGLSPQQSDRLNRWNRETKTTLPFVNKMKHIRLLVAPEFFVSSISLMMNLSGEKIVTTRHYFLVGESQLRIILMGMRNHTWPYKNLGLACLPHKIGLVRYNTILYEYYGHDNFFDRKIDFTKMCALQDDIFHTCKEIGL